MAARQHFGVEQLLDRRHGQLAVNSGVVGAVGNVVKHRQRGAQRRQRLVQETVGLLMAGGDQVNRRRVLRLPRGRVAVRRRLHRRRVDAARQGR